VVADKLTVKQEKFVQGLFAGLTQRVAYKKAFNCAKMKDKSIDERSCVLTNTIKIQSRLADLTNEFKERNMVTVERIVAQLAKIGFADIKDVVTWQSNKIEIRDSYEVDGTILSEVSESLTDAGRTLKVKLNDRMRALEMMGKHLGMFKDGNVNISIGVQIVDDIGVDPDESD